VTIFGNSCPSTRGQARRKKNGERRTKELTKPRGSIGVFLTLSQNGKTPGGCSDRALDLCIAVGSRDKQGLELAAR